MKYYEIATVTASNPWPWANTLRNVNKCENVDGRISYMDGQNFSASFRGVALKFTELIRLALPNQWFSSISYVPLHREWHHHELSFSLCWTCVYFRWSINFGLSYLYQHIILSPQMQKRIWKPDTFFDNVKEARIHQVTLPNVMLRIGKMGDVLYSMRSESQYTPGYTA